MQGNPVVWFEIYVQDMRCAEQPHEAILNVQMERIPAPTPDLDLEIWAFPLDKANVQNSYGASRMLIEMEEFFSGGGGTMIYFFCTDCAVRAYRVAQHGGIVAKTKISIGEHGFIALARDTEGNMIGFQSMKVI